MTSIDLSELQRLAQDLGKVPGRAIKEVDAVVQKAALNIKQEMQADARSSRHFKGLAGSISYDSHYRLGQARYVIGPDKSRPGGALGNIYYFGTSRGGGTGDIDKPLRSEAPRFAKALADAAKGWADL